MECAPAERSRDRAVHVTALHHTESMIERCRQEKEARGGWVIRQIQTGVVV